MTKWDYMLVSLHCSAKIYIISGKSSDDHLHEHRSIRGFLEQALSLLHLARHQQLFRNTFSLQLNNKL